MTIAKTKAQLLHVLSNTENRVIALTGKWGTGKTHLWKEIKRKLDDAHLQKELYALLLGSSRINQVNRKLIETAITGSVPHPNARGAVDSQINQFDDAR